MIVFGHNQPPATADKDIEAYQNKHEEKQNKDCRFWRKWCRHGCPFWCKKYFWEGMYRKIVLIIFYFMKFHILINAWNYR